VVITGMAAVTALGRDLAPLWNAVCAGRSGVSPIRGFDADLFRTRFAGQVSDFDPAPYIDVKEQKRISRFAQFALYASEKAVADAGVDFDDEDPFRCGAIVGSGIGGAEQFEEAHEKIAEGPHRLPPLVIPKMMINSAAGAVAIRFGLHGHVSATATACASGANAIGDAFRLIQYGGAEVMLAGGSETPVTPFGVGGFCAIRALSQRNDDPQGASRPFARDRDGFVLSEGAGVLVLEEYEHARRRGARVYGEILGYGCTADGAHITAPDPEGVYAAGAMKLALRDAMLPPKRVDYVNAHGTGTPLGDKAETLALKLTFGDAVHSINVSSTKSELGHMLGASGAVELILSTLACYHGVAPPTINLFDPDPECDLDYVPHRAREIPICYAMSNSFAFGGHNASLIVGALDEQPQRARMAA
jgi:3-oxoacyl-[acyl-carrier-protein] synthase II